jgi:hypothetical protein
MGIQDLGPNREPAAGAPFATLIHNEAEQGAETDVLSG